jgi:hypothetical protein
MSQKFSPLSNELLAQLKQALLEAGVDTDFTTDAPQAVLELVHPPYTDFDEMLRELHRAVLVTAYELAMSEKLFLSGGWFSDLDTPDMYRSLAKKSALYAVLRGVEGPDGQPVPSTMTVATLRKIFPFEPDAHLGRKIRHWETFPSVSIQPAMSTTLEMAASHIAVTQMCGSLYNLLGANGVDFSGGSQKRTLRPDAWKKTVALPRYWQDTKLVGCLSTQPTTLVELFQELFSLRPFAFAAPSGGGYKAEMLVFQQPKDRTYTMYDLLRQEEMIVVDREGNVQKLPTVAEVAFGRYYLHDSRLGMHLSSPEKIDPTELADVVERGDNERLIQLLKTGGLDNLYVEGRGHCQTLPTASSNKLGHNWAPFDLPFYLHRATLLNAEKILEFFSKFQISWNDTTVKMLDAVNTYGFAAQVITDRGNKIQVLSIAKSLLGIMRPQLEPVADYIEEILVTRKAPAEHVRELRQQLKATGYRGEELKERFYEALCFVPPPSGI